MSSDDAYARLTRDGAWGVVGGDEQRSKFFPNGISVPQPDPNEEVAHLLETKSEISMPSLSVYVDLVELLRHWSDDEKRVIKFVGDLKDLLRS